MEADFEDAIIFDAMVGSVEAEEGVGVGPDVHEDGAVAEEDVEDGFGTLTVGLVIEPGGVVDDFGVVTPGAFKNFGSAEDGVHGVVADAVAFRAGDFC